jgi:tRNA threonylcarbamoyl adenosine modification protein YeaZ
MILAIETNSLYLSLCLLKNNNLVNSFSTSFKNELSEILIPTINKFLITNSIGFQEISILAIGCGPGSFTSIRTLIAAGKGITLSNRHIKSIGINSLAALAMSAIDEAKTRKVEYIISSIDSKRDEPFIQTFQITEAKNNGNLKPVNKIQSIKMLNLKQYLLDHNLENNNILFVGYNKELIPKNKLNLHTLNTINQFSDALLVAKLCYSLFSNTINLSYSESGFNYYKPFYVRFADINQ